MTGRIILAALMSRPSLVRNVGEVKVKRLICAAMARAEDTERTGGAVPGSCSLRGDGPAAGAGEAEGAE